MQCRINIPNKGKVLICKDFMSENKEILLNKDPLLKLVMKQLFEKLGYGDLYYYIVPRFEIINKLYIKIIRMLSRVSIKNSKLSFTNESYKPKRVSIETDYLIIGDGPAGVGAALTLAEYNQRVIIIGNNNEMGGGLKIIGEYIDNDESIKAGSTNSIDDLNIIKNHMKKHGEAIKRIKGEVFGIYKEKDIYVITAYSENNYYLIKAHKIIIAPGIMDGWPLFVNNDLPGLIGGLGALKIINYWNFMPWHEIIIIDLNKVSLHILHSAIKMGVKRVNLIIFDDAKLKIYDSYLQTEKDLERIHIFKCDTIEKMFSGKRIKIQAYCNNKKLYINGDTAIYCGHFVPRYNLPAQAGITIEIITDKINKMARLNVHTIDGTRTEINDIYLAGGVIGCVNPREAYISGQLSALSALIDSGIQINMSHNEYKNMLDKVINCKKMNEQLFTMRVLNKKLNGNEIVCPCYDVKVKDILKALKLGLNDIETIKRYTGIGTGECQGRICMLPTILVMNAFGVNAPNIMKIRPPIIPLHAYIIGENIYEHQ
jgi:bacterioferritin-associated ferredoxin